ncbi:MAG: hypothetical protein AABX82_06450 [Nanoarchaeota archaeon]
MTSTTDYKRRSDLGEIASVLFGTISLSPTQAEKMHTFFQEAVPQYVMDKEYACIFREQLAVDPSEYYSNGAVYDVLDLSSPGTAMEMTVRVQQGKAESVEADRYHYRIRVVLKGEGVSEGMKPDIETKMRNLDTMLFGVVQAKKEEFFRDYAQ